MAPDSPSSSIADQIIGARMLTDLTGEVHDLQVVQLRRWPLLVFEGADSCEVKVGVGDARTEIDDEGNARRQNRPVSVEFNVITGGTVDQDRLLELRTAWKESAKYLTLWTQQLYWPDTTVTIFVDNYRIEPNE